MKRKHLGDKGMTLISGKFLPKSSLIIEVLGSLDELNSAIGLARSFLKYKEVDKYLEKIQEDIFKMGAYLALKNYNKNNLKIKEEDIKFQEDLIDKMEKDLPKLDRFIMNFKSTSASCLHLSRAICRRTERIVSNLNKKEIKVILKYLNRLSDTLFILARYVNKKEGFEEKHWKA